ncbi:MAG: XRE family transcriptional regulator [Candidatus Omnitrophota bacterium]|jgi:transcriptional regulator with XRE-family HTH domain|nr:MAG: XRE family transcriptional regulator [Candidatus Omnitrophota bacterium]
MTDFVEWLEDELKQRDWNRNELSKRGGIDSGLVSRILNRERNAGIETLLAIAVAFNISPEVVFRAAGLLPPLNNKRQVAEHIVNYKLGELSEDQLDDVLAYIEFIQSRDGRRGASGAARYSVTRREGETPPDAVKE